MINPEKLTFKHLIMTIGNLPSSYVESLSYYECLLWLCNYLQETVIPAVNNNASALEELQNLFTQLQSYVENYFDNLDVQEEINNKLDDMVEDGSLTRLISSYVDSSMNVYKEEINEELNEFNNTINEIDNTVDRLNDTISAVVSGSPKGVYESATALQNDNPATGVYITSDNGHIYSWTKNSAESPVDLGLYQSTGIQDGSITYEKLATNLKTDTSLHTIVTNDVADTGYYINDSGEIASITSQTYNYAYIEMDVNPLEKYKVHTGFLAAAYGVNGLVYALVNDSTVVDTYKISQATSDGKIANNYYDDYIEIPTGVNKIRFNCFGNLGSYILKVNKYNLTNISKEQLDSTMQTFFNDVYEEVTPTDAIENGILNPTYQLGSANGYKVKQISVNPGEKYRLNTYQFYSNPVFFYTTNNIEVTKTLSGNTYILKNSVEYYIDGSGSKDIEDYVFTVPEYCSKIYFNTDNSKPFKLEKVTGYKVNSSDVVINTSKIGFNKWYAIGDSITEKNFRALYNYIDYIKDDINGLTVTNLGASGTGYKNGGSIGGQDNTFTKRIESINNYDLENEIITVMGSINDLNYYSDLGQLGDTTTDTLYGSMYVFFSTLFTTFNGVRVGCISPINWKNSNTNVMLKNYTKALKETCELFNVPFLDISDKTNLRPNDSNFLNEYYSSDVEGTHYHEVDSAGVHPNSEGHKLFYNRIKEFIKNL